MGIRFIIIAGLVFSFAAVSCAGKKDTDHKEHKMSEMSTTEKGTMEKAPATENKMVMQKTCPVMGGDINPELYVDADGYRVYVCCEMCVAKVKEDPKKYIAVLEGKGETIEKLDGSK